MAYTIHSTSVTLCLRMCRPTDLRSSGYQYLTDLVSGGVLVVVGSYVSVLADLLSSCTAYVPTGPPYTGLW